MKKLAIILGIVMLISCACSAPATTTAPGTDTAPEAAASEASGQGAPEEPWQGGMPEYSCAISYEELDEDKKADDGTTILLLAGYFPHVEVQNKEPATAAFEAYFTQKVKSFVKELAAETEQMAKNDYAERGEGFMPYDLELKYQTQRADKDCVSFTSDLYSFTGGPYPNMRREGVNFNTATGHVLEFKDIVTDEAGAEEFVNSCIKAYLDANKETFYLFDDYAEHIPEILEDGQWYFTPTEFVVICNEGIIGPHAMGTVEIPIAYSDFTLLNSDYGVAK